MNFMCTKKFWIGTGIVTLCATAGLFIKYQDFPLDNFAFAYTYVMAYTLGNKFKGLI